MMWSLGIADPDSTIEIVMDQKPIHDSETNIFGDSCFFPLIFPFHFRLINTGTADSFAKMIADFYDFLLESAGKSKYIQVIQAI